MKLLLITFLSAERVWSFEKLRVTKSKTYLIQFLRSKVQIRIEVGGKPGKSTLDLPLLTQLRIYEVFSSWQIKKREALLFLNSQQSGKKNILCKFHTSKKQINLKGKWTFSLSGYFSLSSINYNHLKTEK